MNFKQLCSAFIYKFFQSKELKAINFLLKDTYVQNYRLKNLYNLALDIYKLKLSSNNYYYPEVFSTETSGYPRLLGNINIPVHVQTSKKIALNYAAGSVVVKCRRLNIKDLDDQDIYEAENGILFIYLYRPPDAITGYDEGIFTSPRIEFEKIKEVDERFRLVATDLVNQLAKQVNLDETVILSLENRIFEYQRLAYQQAISAKDLFELKTNEYIKLDSLENSFNSNDITNEES